MTSAHAQLDRPRLFLVSVLALATTGIGFSVRSNIASALQVSLFDPVDPLRSAEMVASVLGMVFLGFALTIPIGSALLDFLGMGRLLRLSALCFMVGTMIVILAPRLAGALSVYRLVWWGMALTGVGQGLVEAVINPLTATVYPEEKTHRLNLLHAWWPGGIIIGGLLGVALGRMNFGWQVQLAIVLLPAAVFGALTIGTKFPPTERVAAGVSDGAMFKEAIRPFFLVWFFSMFLTAAAELAPGQWVDFALTRTVGMKGIWLLIYVSGLMFVLRHFAGRLVKRLSPVGLLWVSCLLASIGLLLLSIVTSRITGLLAATVWGAGVCYMWPTMLAVVSERFPRGGALLMGLMGTAGNLSIHLVLPKMGAVFDQAKIRAAGGADAFKELSGAQLNEVLSYAAQYSFRVVALLPAVLLLVLGVIWLRDRARGGYQAVRI